MRVTGQTVVLVSMTTVVMTSDSAGEVAAEDETGKELTAEEVVASTTEELATKLDEAGRVVSIPTALEVETGALSTGLDVETGAVSTTLET